LAQYGITYDTLNSTQQIAINARGGPNTAQVQVTSQVNVPNKLTINGLEFQWVQPLDFLTRHIGVTGFGFNANATIVDTNKPYNRNDISQSGFAVTGLADSANVVAFYDKNGFEVRVAANWRDNYLLQFGQNQNNSAFGAEPTYVNSSLQIDLSTSYQITPELNVFFEALNITDDTQSTHGRYDNQLLDVFSYGRRYALGARYRWQ